MLEIIYNVQYKLYFSLYRIWKNRGSKNAEVLFRVNLKVFRWFLFDIYSRDLEKGNGKTGVNQSPREERIIASLTTFPARIHKVHLTIETIMRQSVKADKIELWLAREQFPQGLDSLPEALLKQQERGLSICFCDDLRSHKKYYYAMKNHPNDSVITFDDDVFYPQNTIADLYACYLESPSQVIGTSCAMFSMENFLSPIAWNQSNKRLLNNNNLCVVGCAGTLFPPNSLSPHAFDIASFKQLCPFADDLWLTAMVYMNDRRIATLGRCPFPISVPDTQEISLTTTNNSAAASINNDTQWNAILEHYAKELAQWRVTIQ